MRGVTLFPLKCSPMFSLLLLLLLYEYVHTITYYQAPSLEHRENSFTLLILEQCDIKCTRDHEKQKELQNNPDTYQTHQQKHSPGPKKSYI